MFDVQIEFDADEILLTVYTAKERKIEAKTISLGPNKALRLLEELSKAIDECRIHRRSTAVMQPAHKAIEDSRCQRRSASSAKTPSGPTNHSQRLLLQMERTTG